jgi:hypothetical protein
MMAIEDGSIRGNFERSCRAGRKRGFQFAGRQAAKMLQFDAIQCICGVQEFQARR